MSQGNGDGLGGRAEACSCCCYGYTRETRIMERKDSMGTLPVLLPSVVAVELLVERGSVVNGESQRNGDWLERMVEEDGGEKLGDPGSP